MKPGNVPTSRIGPLLSELIKDRWPHNGGIEVLAEKVGCDWTAIEGIIKGVHEGVSFDLADKLFCALGRVDVWQGQLSDVYSKVRFVQTCSLGSCSKTFPENQKSGRVQRYCCATCRVLAHDVKNGKRPGLRLRQRNLCKQGHKLKDDNLIIAKRSDGTTFRRCRTCKKKFERDAYRVKHNVPQSRMKVAA